MRNLTDSIREYDPEDQVAVEECLAELQDFSKRIYEQVADGGIAPRYLRHLLDRCQETDGQIFVAESDGRVVGMLSVFARVKSDAVDEEEYEYAYVSDLVVLTDHRAGGLGHALLQRAEAHARSRGATVLRLNVLAQNEVARSLYVRVGFAEHLVVLQKML